MDEILPKIQKFIDILIDIAILNNGDNVNYAMEEAELSKEDLEFFMNSK